MRVKISKRLQSIASLIDDNAIIMDVGTDHALIPIYLAINQRIKKAYATDLRLAPLVAAKQNVEHYNVSNLIELYQCDGINDIKNDVNTIIFAGMGGSLITSILASSLDKIRKDTTFVIQPNLNVCEVRRWLVNNGFAIIDELIIYEDGHYYEMMKIIKEKQILTENDILFGPVLIKQKTTIFIEKYKKELKKYQAILSQVKDKDYNRYIELLNYIKRIEEVL